MMGGKIKVNYCESCGSEFKNLDRSFCSKCEDRPRLTIIERDKKRISGNFEVVDWFSSRSSGGLIVEDKTQGLRMYVYMSDVFKFLEGVNLGNITFEETKKGTAYSWKVIE